MAKHIEIVNSLIDSWKKADIDGVLSRLSDDIEYHYLVGERPLIGKDWVRRYALHGDFRVPGRQDLPLA